MDKIYQWTYSLDTKMLYMNEFDVDVNYPGLYGPGDYIKIFLPDVDGDRDYDYELLEPNKIETEFKTYKAEHGDSRVIVFSYSDDPKHAMELYRDWLVKACDAAKNLYELNQKWLSDAVMKKAEIDLKSHDDSTR